MERKLSIIPLLLALTPALAQDPGLPAPRRNTASHPEPTPVIRTDRFEGVWRVEGLSADAPAYSGQVELRRARVGWTYERRVSAPGLPALIERGRATRRGAGLVLREEQAAAPGLIAELGDTPFARARESQGWMEPAGDDALSGVHRGSAGSGLERWTRLPAATGPNRVELLIDGTEMFGTLREALMGARRSIELQTFIYEGDATGRIVAHYLCERARAGVSVKLLVDKMGMKMGKQLERELRAAGVELIVQHGHLEGLKNNLVDVGRGIAGFFGRLFGKKPKPREKRGLLNHDHRKICVIDSTIGFCGGMNVSEDYELLWHDVHATVRGPAVAELEELFYDRWRAAGGRGEAGAAPPCEARWPVGGVPVDVVAALPGLSTAIKQRYLAEIEGSTRQVNIAMAYFLDDDIISGLKDAVGRGARVTVIIPKDEGHDVPMVRDAFAWSEADVVRSGVHLRKFQARMLHAKVATFDGRCATIGSSNLDNMALTKLAEANLFIPDASFTALVDERVFAADLPRSDPVFPRKLSFWQKLKSGFFHLFRGIL